MSIPQYLIHPIPQSPNPAMLESSHPPLPIHLHDLTPQSPNLQIPHPPLSKFLIPQSPNSPNTIPQTTNHPTSSPLSNLSPIFKLFIHKSRHQNTKFPNPPIPDITITQSSNSQISKYPISPIPKSLKPWIPHPLNPIMPYITISLNFLTPKFSNPLSAQSFIF